MEAPRELAARKIKELTVADCELLAFARVGRPYREHEAFLFTVKWFDYRHLHPVKATYLWSQRYDEAVVALYRETKDLETADDVRGFDTPDVFMGRELTAVWRARQAMDAIGCRYEWGIRWALRRFMDRGWRMFPRPNQLYTTEFLLDLRDAWQAQCRDILELAREPRVTAAHYEGHPDQDAYQAWLVKQVSVRQHKDKIIERLIREGHLLPAAASHSRMVAK